MTEINENTRAHWVLYGLSAFHEEHGVGEGTTTRDLYDRAGGDDGVVFTSARDISAAVTELRELDLVQRRTARMTDWDDEADVEYEIRLSPAGRKVVSTMGAPTLLPERHDDDHARDLPAEPGHGPQWYEDEQINPKMLPEWVRGGEGEIVDEINAERGDVTVEGVDEAIEQFAARRVPDEGERVEASNGEMVEFDHVRDDGTLEFTGPSDDDDDDRRQIYHAPGPETAPEPATIDLSPDWDWLGVQLAKIGRRNLAREAFRGNLSPAVVWDLADSLYELAWEGEYDLDFGSPVPDGLTLVETPYDPEEARYFKEQLGVDEGEGTEAQAEA